MSDIASTIQPASWVDDMLKAYVSPLLRAEGFRKESRTYFRHHGPFSYLINLQLDKWNTSAGGGFFVNLGVSHELVYEATHDRPMPSPKEHYCPVRFRLERLDPSIPQEWEFKTVMPADVVGMPLASAIKRYALPYFDSLTTLPAFRDQLVAKGGEALTGATLRYLETANNLLKQPPRS